MLSQRVRPHRGHGGEGVAPVLPASYENRMLSGGYSEAGRLMQGTSLLETPLSQGKHTSWAEACPYLTEIAQVAGTMVLRANGSLWSWGSVSGGTLGNGGYSHSADEASEDSAPGQNIYQIKGGIPIFPEELLETKSGKTYLQPKGPIGPIITNIAALASHANHRHIMTKDGRALAWGSNDGAELSNGFETKDQYLEGIEKAAKGEAEGWFYQGAPWWVQTEGKPQTVEPGETNILKGIKMIAAGDEVAFYVVQPIGAAGPTQVWYGGSLGATSINVYAQQDTVWKTWAEAHLGSRTITAIAGGKQNYGLVLSDGSLVIVGKGPEGTWGDGTTAPETSAGEHIREVHIPTMETSPGSHVFIPMTGVMGIAKGEYSWIAIKTDYSLWPCGSNAEGQLGLGLPEEAYTSTSEYKVALGTELKPEENVYISHPRQLTSIGTTVRELSMQGTYRGTGTFGGDLAIARLSTGKIKLWGCNHNGGSLAPTFSGTGAILDGRIDNKNVPTDPLNSPVTMTNITQVYSASEYTLLVQENTTLGVPKVRVTQPTKGYFKVAFDQVASAGTFPTLREAESWHLIIKAPEGEEGAIKIAGKNALLYKQLSPSTRLFDTSVEIPEGLSAPFELPSGLYEVAVEEIISQVIVTPTSSLVTAHSGVVTAKWTIPMTVTGGYYVEWQRATSFLRGIEILQTKLSAPISGTITELPVVTTGAGIPKKFGVVVRNGSAWEFFILKGGKAVKKSKEGPYIIPVESEAASSFPSGSEVQDCETVLTAPITTTGGPVTELKVEELLESYAAGTLMRLELPNGNFQIFETAPNPNNATKLNLEGDTILTVVAETPTYNFPAGSSVCEVVRESLHRTAYVPESANELTFNIYPNRHFPTIEPTEPILVKIKPAFEGSFAERSLLVRVP